MVRLSAMEELWMVRLGFWFYEVDTTDDNGEVRAKGSDDDGMVLDEVYLLQ